MTPVDELFDAYVEELRAAKEYVDDWWRRLIEREIKVDGDDDAALERVELRWPTGPVAHPRVIEIYRRYFFSAQELIDAAFDAGGIPPFPHPTAFLVEKLDMPETRDLALFMARLSYSPIGQDDGGDFV